MNVEEAATAVHAALATVPDLRVYTDPAATVDPPGAVVGPPALSWTGYGPGPNFARFIVYVITDDSDRAVERLWDLVPQVVAALESSSDAEIMMRPGEDQATPTVWPNGDLPAYELSIEVTL